VLVMDTFRLFFFILFAQLQADASLGLNFSKGFLNRLLFRKILGGLRINPK
jgi:hypothetical protein